MSWLVTPKAPPLKAPARFFHRFLTIPPPPLKVDLSFDVSPPRPLPVRREVERSLESLPMLSRRRFRSSSSDEAKTDLSSSLLAAPEERVARSAGLVGGESPVDTNGGGLRSESGCVCDPSLGACADPTKADAEQEEEDRNDDDDDEAGADDVCGD